MSTGRSLCLLGSPQNADHADCRLQTVQTTQTVQTVQTEYFFLTLDSLFSVLQLQNSVQYVLLFVIYPQPAHLQHLNIWPPFSLTRDFGKQNTCGNVSKISISLACYWQIGWKSTNHSLLIEVTLQQPFGITFCTPRVENVPDMCGINYKWSLFIHFKKALLEHIKEFP